MPVAGLAQSNNPSSFSLPPGPAPQQPPSNVQGPVDAESTPPRRTDLPEQTAPRETAPQTPPVIAPVPVPQPDTSVAPRERTARQSAQSETTARQEAPRSGARSGEAPGAGEQQQPDDASTTEFTPQTESVAPAVPLPTPDPVPSPAPEATADDESLSTWLWLVAGFVALISLGAMVLQRRKPAVDQSESAQDAMADLAPTPPLRHRPAPAAPPVAKPAAQPVRAAPVAPRPAPPPPAAPAQAQPAMPADPPLRLLLDYSTLGIDVTLVNAVARYHLAITNMSDQAVSDVVLHGAVVQARRGMPPTIDPMQGETLLPRLQPIANIDPEATQRCEGQIRLPLSDIDPILMQGRLLFIPVVHIWIGYSGPDGTRYAVTQSFVLGEESTPPGTRVGPLRLELGPRRFTGIGQRPLLPA